MSAPDAGDGLATRGPLGWILRRVDPATSLSEILFGLIMTLTFTLGAGLIIQDEGREGARQLLVAVLGCNLAWGIIDGVFYLVGVLFEREQLRRLGRRIRAGDDPAAAQALVADHLDELVSGALDGDERAALYRRIVENVRATAPVANRVTRADVAGAIASGLLVALTTLPAAVPFMFLDDPYVALRLSNAVLLALLFGTGWWWARLTTLRPMTVGLAFLAGGVVLVVVAIALGG